jgi:hypothetical protein
MVTGFARTTRRAAEKCGLIFYLKFYMNGTLAAHGRSTIFNEMNNYNILELPRRQLYALVALSLVAAIIATFARIQFGERQAIERLIAMNSGGYGAMVSVFDPEQMKAMHVDADGLFSQFIAEFTKYHGELRQASLTLGARTDRKSPQLAYLSMSGPSGSATADSMDIIVRAVRGSIEARTRQALAASRSRSLAQIEAKLGALAEITSHNYSIATMESLTGRLPADPPAVESTGSTSRAMPRGDLATAPGPVVYVADPLLGLLMERRMLAQFDVSQLQIPIFDIVQQKITPSPFNLPAWLLALAAASLTVILGYGVIIANRFVADEDDRAPYSPPSANRSVQEYGR